MFIEFVGFIDLVELVGLNGLIELIKRLARETDDIAIIKMRKYCNCSGMGRGKTRITRPRCMNPVISPTNERLLKPKTGFLAGGILSEFSAFDKGGRYDR